MILWIGKTVSGWRDLNPRPLGPEPILNMMGNVLAAVVYLDSILYHVAGGGNEVLRRPNVITVYPIPIR